jgi:hypothetical protein
MYSQWQSQKADSRDDTPWAGSCLRRPLLDKKDRSVWVEDMTAILGTEVDDTPWAGSCLRRPLLDKKDRFDKTGLPEDGERRQIVVDDFNDEPAGSQLREAKDLVHTLASSQTAQSTLANVARSASGLHSRQGTTAQSFHADGEYNLNSPADIGVHPLWRNLYLVSVQPVQSPTALNVVPGSAQLMALLPEDCSDTGRCWNMDELCKRAGLPGFGCALPHLSLSLFPGSYVMFLDHFIHGGGACCDQFGSWRVHMYSDGIGTHDRVAHLETCLLGPKCCSIAGIPGPQWGHSTDVDAQSITCGLLQRALAALHLRTQCHQLTPTPWAKI